MKNCRNLNDCFESVPEAISARNWASICKIIGWVIVGVFVLLGIILGSLAYTGGFLTFLIATMAGFMSAATFWILGAILDAMAVTAQSSTETARMTYWRLQADMKELSEKRIMQQKEQQEKRKEEEDRAFQARVVDSTVSQKESESKTPAAPWLCQYCGKENSPWDNICNDCGQKKVD